MIRSPARRLVGPRPRDRRQDMLGLASRLVPLVILAAGMIVWSVSVSQAQPPYNVPGQAYDGPGQAYDGPGQAYDGTGQRNDGSGQGYNGTQPYAQSENARGPIIPAAAEVDVEQAAAGSVGEAGTDDEAADEPTWRGMALIAKVREGGWLMLPLAVCSLLVFALSLERMMALRRGRVIPRPFVRRFTECVEDGQLSYEEASEICAEFDCPVAEVFQAAVRRWGRPMLEIEQAVMDAGDRVADGLKRFVRVFHAISNVAPLLGLLGTVLGMIEAFEMMSSQESVGRPEMLASGISTALVTTAGGLGVAIPAYLAYMYFSSKTDRYLGEIDRLCQRVVDCISAEGLESNGQARGPRKRRAA